MIRRGAAANSAIDFFSKVVLEDEIAFFGKEGNFCKIKGLIR